MKILRSLQNSASEVPFALIEGEDAKLYAWFKDTAGNVTNAAGDSTYGFNAGCTILFLVLIQLAFIL
jgi:hypothetical protein